MPLKLGDLLQKAKDKGITAPSTNTIPKAAYTRPWQSESVLFQDPLSVKKSEDLIIPDKEHIRNTIGTHKEHSEAPPDTTDPNDLYDKHQSLGTQLEHNKDTIKTQKEHLENTTGTHQEHKPKIKNTTRTQLGHVKEHNKDHKSDTIRTHKEHKDDKAPELSYLCGIQKDLLVFLYQSCKKNRSRTTEPFALSTLSEALNIRHGSVKTSLRRLEEKHFIKSSSFKKGRGGWSQFEIPDLVYSELLYNEKEHNWSTSGTQLEHNKDTYRNTEKDTNDTRRRRDYINNISSSSDENDPWNFSIEPYEKFGFNATRLKQLKSKNRLTAEEVKQSLDEFEHDVINGTLPKINTSPISYLMGGLINGSPYTSENMRQAEIKAAEEMKKKYAEMQALKKQNIVMSLYEALKDDERNKMISEMPRHLQIRHNVDGPLEPNVFEWLTGYLTNTQ